MARIILTIPGPWSKLDETLEAQKPPQAELRWLPPDYQAAVDIVAVGRKAGVFTDEEVGQLRKHVGLIEYEATFERQGDRGAATATARFAVAALQAGAQAVFVDTSLRVLTADTLKGAELDDGNTLFHLFVEILLDDEAHEVATEGMQCFDLPDVVVPFTAGDAESGTAAQATAFSLAAQMVCDRFRPTAGSVFRASESAPWYRLALKKPDPDADPDDAFENPRGTFVLTPRK